MNRVTGIVSVLVAFAVVGFTFVIGLSLNEAQRIGVERQQTCVEAGGSWVELTNGQLCLMGSEVAP